MIPQSFLPYAERVAQLAPRALDDGWRPDGLSSERVYALAVAAGRLLRYAASLEQLGQPADDVRRATAPAWLALYAAENLLPKAGSLDGALAAVANRVRMTALESWTEDQDEPLTERLARYGDPNVAAERLDLLWEADDVLSVAAALEHLGHGFRPTVLAASLQVARQLREGLDSETWWRVEAVAEDEAHERELYTDRVGSVLWCALLDPSRRAELLGHVASQIEFASAGAEAQVEVIPARVAAHGADDRPPGEIHMLVWDSDSNVGYPLLLQITADPTASVWGRNEKLAPVAWNAVRTAYLAAAQVLPGALPPRALEGHRIRIHGDVRVDGDSLGLAVALAFVSLWTDQPLPEGAAATGVVDARGNVLRVNAKSLAAKLEGWRVPLGSTRAPVLVPDQGADLGGIATACLSLGGALAAFGLKPSTTVLKSELGDVGRREAALFDCIRAVEQQAIASYAVVRGANPWVLLADRICVLVESLKGAERLRVDLREAQVRAAIAYLHAGEQRLAANVLADLGEGPLPPVLQLLAAVARLGVAIDRVDMAEAERVDAEIAGLLAGPHDADLEVALHEALGTRGRYRLHAGDASGALPLLEDAVAAAPPWERGRSRIYVAMAKRSAGDPAAALVELDVAERELEDMRVRSESYASQTRIYVRYEQARAALDLGRVDEALQRIREALIIEGGAQGWWPRAGLLRVEAQALRAAGRTVEYEARVADLEALRGRVPDEYRELFDSIAHEASGSWTGAPVVY